MTLQDALYIDVKNDVGYLFHDVMNLIEQQSTYNPNMPLRGLGYFGDTYKEYISEVFSDSTAIYNSKLLKIPAPRYYVLYNGTAKQPEEMELRLSDAFKGDGDIEVVAHMLNINKGHNEALMEACRPLQEYSEIVHRVMANKEAGYGDEEAVAMALDSCIDDDILAGILRKERDKVSNILIRGLTEEEKKHLVERELEIAREDAMEEGREQGLEEGRKAGLELGRKAGLELGRKEKGYEAVDKIVAKGLLSAEEACEMLDVDIEAYCKYESGKISD